MTVRTTFNLKADGAKLSGTATIKANGRSRDLPVQNGKIDGKRFSFTTLQRGRDGERCGCDTRRWALCASERVQ